MEHQQYTIPAEKAAQHIKHVVPKQAIVHYWYEMPKQAANEESAPEVEVKHPQLKAFLDDMEASGGLLPDDVDAMDKHGKAFRDNFDL